MGGERKKATLIVTVPGYCSHSLTHASLCLGAFYHAVARELQLSVPFLYLKEKATWLPLSEGEEGNGDRTVMRWDFLKKKKVGCVLRHLSKCSVV